MIDIYNSLRAYTSDIRIFDPWVSKEFVKQEYGIEVSTDIKELERGEYDAVIYCVKHTCFDAIGLDSLRKPEGVFYDVKGTLDKDIVTDRL